jgi:hypothetical protein
VCEPGYAKFGDDATCKEVEAPEPTTGDAGSDPTCSEAEPARLSAQGEGTTCANDDACSGFPDAKVCDTFVGATGLEMRKRSLSAPLSLAVPKNSGGVDASERTGIGEAFVAVVRVADTKRFDLGATESVRQGNEQLVVRNTATTETTEAATTAAA